jgi:hypothetical protein
MGEILKNVHDFWRARLGAMPTLAVGMLWFSRQSLHAHDKRGHDAGLSIMKTTIGEMPFR